MALSISEMEKRLDALATKVAELEAELHELAAKKVAKPAKPKAE